MARKGLELWEENKLLEYLKDQPVRDRCLVLLALRTGLRNAEVLGLNVGDVKVGASIVRNLELRGEICKNGKARWCPLVPEVQALLQAWLLEKEKRGESLAHDAPLFVSNNKRRLLPRDFQRIVKAAGAAALGRSITPHAFRHTYANRILAKTGDLRTLQELLGHSSLVSTQIYTEPTLDMMRDAVERTFGPR